MALRIQGLMLWLQQNDWPPDIHELSMTKLHDLLMTYMRNVSSSNFGRNWLPWLVDVSFWNEMRYQLVGLTSYARFGHLDSADGSNILEVVAEHINRKRSPAKFFGLALRAWIDFL